MKRRKALGVLAGLAAGALYFSASGIMSYALPGWDNSSGEWKYNNAREESMTNVWRQSGPRWYYLGSDGKLLKDSLRGGLVLLRAHRKVLPEGGGQVQEGHRRQELCL